MSAPVTWRHRMADRLVGGELLALRASEVKNRRLLEQLRVANQEERTRRREALARMYQALALDVTRERQMRAVVLLGALLHRFRRDPDRQVLVATASQSQLDHWCSVHEDLARPRDEEPVTDREPAQPAVVHPSSTQTSEDAS